MCSKQLEQTKLYIDKCIRDTPLLYNIERINIVNTKTVVLILESG